MAEQIRKIDERFAKQDAETRAQLLAGNDAIGAYNAYNDEKWALAYERGVKACTGNEALGCEVVGWLLDQGRLGTPDPRGAEQWHRKAGNLFAASCQAGAARNNDCLAAGEFFASNAVPAVRDPAQARKFFSTASKGFSASCERYGDDCFYAGYLANGDFTGRADPAAAARFWRRGCENERQSDGYAGINCDELAKLLVYGPAGVKNDAEARKQIETGKCSAAAPLPGQSYRVDQLFCAIAAEYLFDGIGGKQDRVLAERLMRYSCEFGQESACASLQTRGLARDDYKGAVALRDLGLTDAARDRFETLCTANNKVACNEAGRIYNRDPNDADKAMTLRYYDRACVLGEIIGCANQGDVLRRRAGQGDFVAARAPLGKACDAKDAISCNLLGLMNQQGEGGPVDWIEAARLYRAACDGNNAAGCANLGFIYLNGNGVAKDDVMARTLHEKGCTLGSSSGCNSFAYAMMIGRGGPRDEAQARPIFEKECGRNNGNSCDNLGVLLRDGRGGPADQVKARAVR